MKGEETRSLTRKSRRASLTLPLKALGLISSYVPPCVRAAESPT